MVTSDYERKECPRVVKQLENKAYFARLNKFRDLHFGLSFDRLSVDRDNFIAYIQEHERTLQLSLLRVQPAANEPSMDVAELSKTCTIYTQGQSGAPPPILIPTRFFSAFFNVQVPDVRVKPLESREKHLDRRTNQPSDEHTEYLRMTRTRTSFEAFLIDQYLRLPRSILLIECTWSRTKYCLLVYSNLIQVRVYREDVANGRWFALPFPRLLLQRLSFCWVLTRAIGLDRILMPIFQKESFPWNEWNDLILTTMIRWVIESSSNGSLPLSLCVCVWHVSRTHSSPCFAGQECI